MLFDALVKKSHLWTLTLKTFATFKSSYLSVGLLVLSNTK